MRLLLYQAYIRIVTKTVLVALCDIIGVTPMASDKNIFLSETSFSWCSSHSVLRLKKCYLFLFFCFLDYDTTKTQGEINRLVELNNHRRLCNIVEEILRRKSPRFRS